MATSGSPSVEFNNYPETENSVPEWVLASRGIKLLINNNGPEAEKLFLQYPDSLVMYAGYSFIVFLDALTSFEDEKFSRATSTLKELEKRCTTENGFLKNLTKVFSSNTDSCSTRTLAQDLETQIILADSQVCLATLTFLQHDISGYVKGGWVLRKAWRLYQRLYNEIRALYKEHIGDLQLPDPIIQSHASSAGTSENDDENENLTTEDWDVSDLYANGYSKNVPNCISSTLNQIPENLSHHPQSSCNKENTTKNYFLKKSLSVSCALAGRAKSYRMSSWVSRFGLLNKSYSFSNFSSTTNLCPSVEKIKARTIDKKTIVRLMSAISFGYGLFQLGASLLPPSVMKLTSVLGFGSNRACGITCLMYARLGPDMRAPLATLGLLWYHTILRPFYAIDGTNVDAGTEAAHQLLQESEEQYGISALFLFFKGRVGRLKADIPAALASFQQSAENASQKELKHLSLYEVGWCHLISLDYNNASRTFEYLKGTSKWSMAFYSYLSLICRGASNNVQSVAEFNQHRSNLRNCTKVGKLDEFLGKRLKCFPDNEQNLSQLQSNYWKILVFEMLYLWNALPSCDVQNISVILDECGNVEIEPMVGLSHLIGGFCLCIGQKHVRAMERFRACLSARRNIHPQADDAHISAFAQFELANILIRDPETEQEGVFLLRQIKEYKGYDFESRLTLRVHSTLKKFQN